MPVYRVKLPSGQILPIKSDKELDKDQLKSAVNRYISAMDIDLTKEGVSGTAPYAPKEFSKSIEPTSEEIVTQDTIPKERSFLEKAKGVGELGLSAATGIVSEPLAGLAGLRTLAYGKSGEEAASAIENVRKTLTYEPRGEVAKEYGQKIGEFISPAVEGYKEKIADPIAEQLGPAAGAAAMATPAAAIEALGFKGMRAAGKARKATKVAGEIAKETAGEISEQAIKQEAKRVGIQAGKLSEERAMKGIAKNIEPNLDVIEAAESLGMTEDLLGSQITDNLTTKVIEQSLEKLPVSPIASKKVSQLKQLAKEADKTVEMLGGTTDKSLLSENFKSAATSTINKLENEANILYESVKKQIKPETKVKPKSMLEHLQKRIDEVGEDLLSKNEKLLWNTLKDGSTSYGKLDHIRKQIGSGYKNKGLFKDASRYELDSLYGPLQEDLMRTVRSKGGSAYGELRLANTQVVIRKGIENKLVKLLGKDLMGDISKKSSQAIKNLGKGYTKEWDELIQNMPKQIDPKLRQEILVSSLDDVFKTTGGKFNLKGFDDFIQGVKKNAVSSNRLKEVIGDTGYKRLQDLGTLTNAIRKAEEKVKVPGIIKTIDSSKSLIERLYGKVKIIPGVTMVGSAGKLIKGLQTGNFNSLLKQTPRSVKAAELISDPRFIRLLADKAANKITPSRAEKILETIKPYKNWLTTIHENELKELMTVGGLGYIMGESFTPQE